jgi:nitrogen fixation NifU-like protein
METINNEDAVRRELSAIYSPAAVDHIMRPRNWGAMATADGQARITGPCGDTMAVWLRVRDKTITAAAFETDGCGATVACGSILTELATGQTLAGAMSLGPQAILDALGGLPAANEHCALLAANTLKAAAKDCLGSQKEPWKRSYRS